MIVSFASHIYIYFILSVRVVYFNEGRERMLWKITNTIRMVCVGCCRLVD